MSCERSRRAEAVGPAPGRPTPEVSPDHPVASERMVLERAKREVMELRYKVRRFEEIKVQFPACSAKAHRYDTLVRELIPVALLALIGRMQPIIAWVARRQNS